MVGACRSWHFTQAPQPRFLRAAIARLLIHAKGPFEPTHPAVGSTAWGACGAWGQGEGSEGQRGPAPEAACEWSEGNKGQCLHRRCSGDRSDPRGQHKPRAHVDPTCFSTHLWLWPQPLHHQPYPPTTQTTASIKSSSLTRGTGNTQSI